MEHQLRLPRGVIRPAAEAIGLDLVAPWAAVVAGLPDPDVKQTRNAAMAGAGNPRYEWSAAGQVSDHGPLPSNS